MGKDLRAREYAYFPLHVNPEASTLVFSPEHSNQLQVLESLVRALPPSLPLVVKEHSPMVGWRPEGFYARLQSLGIRILSPLMDSEPLIRNSAMTAVITGTSAWEAILFRRPALVIGNLPFCHFQEGAVHWQDLATLHEGVERTLSLSPANVDTLERYLAALFSQTFSFPSQLYWGGKDLDLVRKHAAIGETIATRLIAL